MSLTHLTKNDYGTVIEVEVQEDNPTTGLPAAANISLFTTLEMIFQAPDGTLKTRVAGFQTDGSDGIIEYTLVVGDLDQVGEWQLQVHLANAVQDVRSSPPLPFRVGIRL